MDLDNLNIKNVFNQDEKVSLLKYCQLKYYLQKLMQYDKKRDCFGDREIFQLVVEIMGHYDLFTVNKNFCLLGGVLVGRPYEEKIVMNIAYVVKEKYRGQGIGNELLGRAIKTCFDEYDCFEIKLSTSVDNIPSIKMIENYNFQLVDAINEKDRMGQKVKQLTYSLDFDQYLKNYDRFTKYKSLFDK